MAVLGRRRQAALRRTELAAVAAKAMPTKFRPSAEVMIVLPTAATKRISVMACEACSLHEIF